MTSTPSLNFQKYRDTIYELQEQWFKIDPEIPLRFVLGHISTTPEEFEILYQTPRSQEIARQSLKNRSELYLSMRQEGDESAQEMRALYLGSESAADWPPVPDNTLDDLRHSNPR